MDLNTMHLLAGLKPTDNRELTNVYTVEREKFLIVGIVKRISKRLITITQVTAADSNGEELISDVDIPVARSGTVCFLKKGDRIQYDKLTKSITLLSPVESK